MQIRQPNQQASFPKPFGGAAQAQGGGQGIQQPRVSPQQPQVSPQSNPFKGAAGLGKQAGGSQGTDALGAFKQQMASGGIKPNLGQPPIPPEGAGKRLLAVG